MRKIIVLMGAPGAGKGTLARLLRERMRLPQISPGDMFREIRNVGKPLSREMRAVMDAGLLISDSLVNRMVRERTRRPDCRAGYILDGFPRTAMQAELLEELAREQGNEIVTVFVDVPVEILEKRITGRRLCPVCGEIYNINYRPSRSGKFCDRHPEAELFHRTDDYPQKVKVRLGEYEEKTRPLIDRFGVLYLVNGAREPEAIYADITKNFRSQFIVP